MHLTAALLLSASVTAGTAGSDTFDNYTDAYWTANEASRPLLVVLTSQDSESTDLDLEALVEEKPELEQALDNYVVAVVDTNTDRGQKIHKLFKSRTLPYLAIIDDAQDKQIYRHSGAIGANELVRVLDQHKDGRPAPAATTVEAFFAGGDCPSCRRFQNSNFGSF